MHSKARTAHRIKNTAKPSSSSRSAELLGTETSIGFPTQSSHTDEPSKMVLSFNEYVTDSVDNKNLHNLIRKLGKKDPTTKKKAMRDILDDINCSNVEQVALILPLWSKIYQNLSCDPTHNVRELAQTVQQLLVSKCNRMIAPYLKQLVPVWLFSHFDNYVPAAVIARSSFYNTFKVDANRIHGVCLYCQLEILEYIANNISTTTLTSDHRDTDEAVDQLDHNKIYCSLKALSFFAEHTTSAELSTKSQRILRSILGNTFFWNCGKSGDKITRVAWFEAILNLLQNSTDCDLIGESKWDIIEISFNGIDEPDRTLSQQIWKCILFLQSKYDDWYEHLDFQNVVLPKLSSLLHNNFFNNIEALCSYMLPFCSALSSGLREFDWHVFFKQFLMDLKQVFCTEFILLTESDYNAIFEAYFECCRFILDKLNSTQQQKDQKHKLSTVILCENIVDPIEWFLTGNNNTATRLYSRLMMKVLIDWNNQSKIGETGLLYTHLLKEFWKSIFNLITKLNTNEKHFPEDVIELINHLVQSNRNMENKAIVMTHISNESDSLIYKMCEGESSFIADELKTIALQLVHHCLKEVASKESDKCLKHVHTLIEIFPDADFCRSITSECDLIKSLNHLLELTAVVDRESYDTFTEIIFKFLMFLNTAQQFTYIKTQLLTISSREIQILILQRLLANHLNIGERRDELLSGSEARDVILNITRAAVLEKSRNTINWLQTLFLRNEFDEFIVGAITIDAVLCTLTEPFRRESTDEIVEICGSLISRIMPIVFSKGNAYEETKTKMLKKLLQFSMEHSAGSCVSENTISMVTACWEDVLSNESIITEEIILHCTTLMNNKLMAKNCTTGSVNKLVQLTVKFIIGVIKDIQEEEKRLIKFKDVVIKFLHSTDLAELGEKMKEYCLFFESLKGIVMPEKELHYHCLRSADVNVLFKRVHFNFHVIKTMHELENINCYSLNVLNDTLCMELQNCISITSTAESLSKLKTYVDANSDNLLTDLLTEIKSFICNQSDLVDGVKEKLLHDAVSAEDISARRTLLLMTFYHQYAQFEENAAIILSEDLFNYFQTQNALPAYINCLQYLLPELNYRCVSVQNVFSCVESISNGMKCAAMRCLVLNYFKIDECKKNDNVIIVSVMRFTNEIGEKYCAEKRNLYSVKIGEQSFATVVDVVEYIRLLTEILNKFPWHLSSKNWDNIRIGLSSWVLSVLKSTETLADPKVALFSVSVCKLFAALAEFIISEKKNSSSVLINKAIDEWEALFAKEVNVVIFKSTYQLLKFHEMNTTADDYFSSVFNEIMPAVKLLNFEIIYNFYKHATVIGLEDIFNYLLKNLSSPILNVQKTCFHILRHLTQFFVVDDIKTFQIPSDKVKTNENLIHYLKKFEAYIVYHGTFIEQYVKEFSFKISEIDEFDVIDNQKAFSFLLMWDCIIHTCVKSPVFLRTVYTSWLHEERYVENFLHFLFRAMPKEILKKHDSKLITCDNFTALTWEQINDENLNIERYACHLYTEVLKKLPAVVRKWWNNTPYRQKTFVDKLTTNFVSPLICSEELKSISTNREKHENMQVTVHLSTREVLAVYFIDEIRTELAITLSCNYPLGGVKVNCGKQIGGRLSSRNIAMQLALFLTHQNGTILDGLTLWKNNLDKRFEGVEECYICYTVIHQDTGQLPKRSCKTCKKRFHGSCLYKWFTTSSKSTCPICRNVF